MIQDDKDTLLQIVATNMHLSPKFGNTYREIENDGIGVRTVDGAGDGEPGQRIVSKTS